MARFEFLAQSVTRSTEAVVSGAPARGASHDESRARQTTGSAGSSSSAHTLTGQTRPRLYCWPAAVGVVCLLSLLGCHPAHKAPVGEAVAAGKLPAADEVGVDQVAALLRNGAASVVDANGPETRREYGVVPGAILLSSARDFALSELPESKGRKLVFYCGGTLCRASDAAAKRAIQAGYSNVSVMRAGIRGWKQAGQQIEVPKT